LQFFERGSAGTGPVVHTNNRQMRCICVWQFPAPPAVLLIWRIISFENRAPEVVDVFGRFTAKHCLGAARGRAKRCSFHNDTACRYLNWSTSSATATDAFQFSEGYVAHSIVHGLVSSDHWTAMKSRTIESCTRKHAPTYPLRVKLPLQFSERGLAGPRFPHPLKQALSQPCPKASKSEILNSEEKSSLFSRVTHHGLPNRGGESSEESRFLVPLRPASSYRTIAAVGGKSCVAKRSSRPKI
jgi:hypothetical protein